MTIGPLQLVLINLKDRRQVRPISQELTAARKKGIIRLVDMLYVAKDPDGTLQSKEYSDLDQAEKVTYGTILKGLLGMRAAYTSGGDVDKIANALSLTDGDFGLTNEQVQNIAAGVPDGGSAIMVLFEHAWAVDLKEAVINAGGDVVAQGLLNPKALAIGGTTLQEAMDAAQSIEAAAEQAAAEEVAKAEQVLSEAEEKLTEAEQSAAAVDEAAAAKLEEADAIAAATIAASVRVAAEELQEADEVLEAGQEAAAAEVAMGAEIAAEQIEAGEGEMIADIKLGREIAQAEIEAGYQTAEEIKAAAATEALRLLFQAKLIQEGAVREAYAVLVSAAMIEQRVAEDEIKKLSPPGY
jgi:uncharacterized membrane protein